MQTGKTTFYGDFSALAELKQQARAQSPEALRKVAQEFESLFTNMMLKSMRAASFGDALTGSGDMDFYQGMYDQQLATQLSKGKGMGLADMLVEQLTRAQGMQAPQPATPADAQAAASDTTAVEAAALPTSLPATGASGHTQAQFVAGMLPYAKQAAQQLGVDPQLLVAHAALETGWGQHTPRNADGSSSFNLFGIKATPSWQGGSASSSTLEYRDGSAQQERAEFRAYDSPQHSFADYSRVLSQPRYAALRGAGNDAERFAHTLQSAGYATDPDYALKLKRVIASVNQLVTPAASG